MTNTPPQDQTTAGQPVAGQSAASTAAAGTAAVGQPAAGTAAVGQPAAGQADALVGPNPTFLNFFVEKILPNFLIWLVAYIVLGKILYPHVFKETKPIEWNHLVDLPSWIAFVVGALFTLVIGYISAKAKPNLGWLFARIREEASSATVNLCSIAIVAAVPTGNLALGIVACVGYFVAWRII